MSSLDAPSQHDPAHAHRPRAAVSKVGPLPHVMVEAIRVLAFGACVGITLGVLRGVPDVGAMRAQAPTSCAPPVLARPEIRWIEQAEARALVEDTAAVFVDARPRAAYEAGHVAGALSVPMETGVLDDGALALVRGSRTVVAYCDTSGDCASSRRLAGLLAEAGLPDVRVLRGGMPSWLESGHPAEAGPCRICP